MEHQQRGNVILKTENAVSKMGQRLSKNYLVYIDRPLDICCYVPYFTSPHPHPPNRHLIITNHANNHLVHDEIWLVCLIF